MRKHMQLQVCLQVDQVYGSAVNLNLGNIFRELRISCIVAQMEREGGVSPRVSPLAQVNFYCHKQDLATVTSARKIATLSREVGIVLK